jgi:hypothetical protein
MNQVDHAAIATSTASSACSAAEPDVITAIPPVPWLASKKTGAMTSAASAK